MKAVETVEIDRPFFARGRLRDRNARAERIVSPIFERDDRVETIHTAPLKDNDKNFSASSLLSLRGPHKKGGRQSQGEEPPPGSFEKESPRRIHDYLL